MSCRHRRWWVIPLAVAFLLLPACGGQTIAPFQPEIRNLTDSFEFQVTSAKNVTQDLAYTWQNTGTMANVNQASSIAGGTANLTLRDAQGAVIYVRSLAENGTFTTNAGAAGD